MPMKLATNIVVVTSGQAKGVRIRKPLRKCVVTTLRSQAKAQRQYFNVLSDSKRFEFMLGKLSGSGPYIELNDKILGLNSLALKAQCNGRGSFSKSTAVGVGLTCCSDVPPLRPCPLLGFDGLYYSTT